MMIKSGGEYIPQVKELILDYTHSLGRDLSFQNLGDELNDLKSKYCPPNGEMLVAIDGDDILGMVAYYKHDDVVCEMKRLYVVPEARGLHLGDELVSEIISHARNNGLKVMLLDTVKPLKAAINLYKKHGFVECEAYYDNPMEDVIYMKRLRNSMIIMFTYPKILRRKDLKKIDKFSCDVKIKEAYLKYLTNYSFSEFVEFCEDNEQMNFEDLLFKFTDLQLEKFEPNSVIWVSHVMLNFMIYFDVNLDYGEYYDAYASALQLTVLSISMKIIIDKIPFEEVPLQEYSKTCFKKLFDKCPNFKFDLNNDCKLAYKSFNNDFGFSSDEFFQKVKDYFENESYGYFK